MKGLNDISGFRRSQQTFAKQQRYNTDKYVPSSKETKVTLKPKPIQRNGKGRFIVAVSGSGKSYSVESYKLTNVYDFKIDFEYYDKVWSDRLYDEMRSRYSDRVIELLNSDVTVLCVVDIVKPDIIVDIEDRRLQKNLLRRKHDTGRVWDFVRVDKKYLVDRYNSDSTILKYNAFKFLYYESKGILSYNSYRIDTNLGPFKYGLENQILLDPSLQVTMSFKQLEKLAEYQETYTEKKVVGSGQLKLGLAFLSFYLEVMRIEKDKQLKRPIVYAGCGTLSELLVTPLLLKKIVSLGQTVICIDPKIKNPIPGITCYSEMLTTDFIDRHPEVMKCYYFSDIRSNYKRGDLIDHDRAVIEDYALEVELIRKLNPIIASTKFSPLYQGESFWFYDANLVLGFHHTELRAFIKSFKLESYGAQYYELVMRNTDKVLNGYVGSVPVHIHIQNLITDFINNNDLDVNLGFEGYNDIYWNGSIINYEYTFDAMHVGYLDKLIQDALKWVEEVTASDDELEEFNYIDNINYIYRDKQFQIPGDNPEDEWMSVLCFPNLQYLMNDYTKQFLLVLTYDFDGYYHWLNKSELHGKALPYYDTRYYMNNMDTTNHKIYSKKVDDICYTLLVPKKQKISKFDAIVDDLSYDSDNWW